VNSTLPAPQTDANPLGLSVLVIEDESLTAQILGDYLHDLGCTVVGWGITAADAERLCAARPDLVIMDYALKGDEHGLAAAHRVRAVCDVPFVFISGMHRPDVVAQLPRFPRSTFLQKPFTPEALRDAMIEAAGRDP
jgi:CheY-like chemotaxis protein